MLRASTQFDVSKLTSLLENCGQALAALGLKSGGTVQQRAERLFLTKVRIANSASLFQWSGVGINVISLINIPATFGTLLTTKQKEAAKHI
jgi:hypothetical protein